MLRRGITSSFQYQSKGSTHQFGNRPSIGQNYIKSEKSTMSRQTIDKKLWIIDWENDPNTPIVPEIISPKIGRKYRTISWIHQTSNPTIRYKFISRKTFLKEIFKKFSKKFKIFEIIKRIKSRCIQVEGVNRHLF